jgi:hypothetical protein
VQFGARGLIPIGRVKHGPTPLLDGVTVDSHANYLTPPNWQKYQPKLKNGKPNRQWIRVECNLEDDYAFSQLSIGEYATLTTIWRLIGRSGKNVPYDPDWIRRRLPSGKHTTSIVLGWLQHITSIGLLVLTDQQNVEEFAPRDVTGQDKTIQPPKVPRKQTPLAEYSEDFEKFWKCYPRKIGKGKAWQEFQRAHFNGNLPDVLASVERCKLTVQWQDITKVPHPSTWLHQRRWEDQITDKELTWDNQADPF